MKEITLLLTLDKMKIISVNDLYKAKVSYRGSKAYPQIYKNPKAAQIESSIFSQMSAINFTEEQLDLLRTKKKFSFRYNFILKSGIKSRDLGNLEKSITDIFVKFVNKSLGIEKFDDSQILEIQMTKSIIPNASAEYIGLQITESYHNVRFDEIEKPERIYLRAPEYLKPIKKFLKTPEMKEKKLKLFSEVDEESKLEKCNTNIYVITPETEYPVTELTRLLFQVKDCIEIGRGLIWVALIGDTWDDNIHNEISRQIELREELEGPGKDHVKVEFVNKLEDIFDYE